MLRRSKRLFLLFSAFACAGARGPSAEPPIGVPFRISSLGAGYIVQGAFWGATTLTADHINVRVDSALVRRPDPGMLRIPWIRLRAGLGVPTEGGRWRMRQSSDSIVLPESGTSTLFTLGPTQFRIATPEGFDSAKEYLFFQFEFAMPTMADPTASPATTYACGRPGMFLRADTSAALAALRRNTSPC